MFVAFPDMFLEFPSPRVPSFRLRLSEQILPEKQSDEINAKINCNNQTLGASFRKGEVCPKRS